MTRDSLPPAFGAATDSFGMTAPLSHQAYFPVLGVPLLVRSNAAAAIRMAEQSFGTWLRLPSHLIDLHDRATMDVVVHADADGSAAALTMPVLRRHGPVYMAGAGANLFATVLAERHAVCFVTPDALADERWYRTHVNANGRFVASLVDRVPLHAAAVVRHGTAIVLLGASGVGKSTLCYACARAGFAVLAEEVVHVSRRGGLRLWGDAENVSLEPDVQPWFPELSGLAPTLRADGVRKVMVRLDADTASPLVHGGRVIVCAIERVGPGRTLAQRLTAADVRSALARPAGQGFDLFADDLPAVADAMAHLPAWRLSVARDLSAAVEAIGHLAEVR